MAPPGLLTPPVPTGTEGLIWVGRPVIVPLPGPVAPPAPAEPAALLVPGGAIALEGSPAGKGEGDARPAGDGVPGATPVPLDAEPAAVAGRGTTERCTGCAPTGP